MGVSQDLFARFELAGWLDGWAKRVRQRFSRTITFIALFKARSLDGVVRCHFCEEEVVKSSERDGVSLIIHSLDGSHDNWDPANKVPAHLGCHNRYHNTIGPVDFTIPFNETKNSQEIKRWSRQALAFLRYLRERAALVPPGRHYDGEAIRGFLFVESEDNMVYGQKGELIAEHSRYNSMHRTVLKLLRRGYVSRTGWQDIGYDYKITKKGITVLESRAPS